MNWTEPANVPVWLSVWTILVLVHYTRRVAIETYTEFFGKKRRDGN